MQLMVFCSKPGLGVAGTLHPQAASYPVTHFSEAQLREMIADRHLSVAVGAPLTAGDVSGFIAEHGPAKAATKKAGG